MLESARAVGLGEHFIVDGTEWQRVSAKIDAERRDPTTAPIRAVNRVTGKLVQLTHTENQAFWQWAIVETLRLAGLRAEELTELTHLSVRNYQRPSGEVVALLVITPSKSDRERVIPMSAELFHVIAQIIRRHISARHRSDLRPIRPARKGLERAAALPVPKRARRGTAGDVHHDDVADDPPGRGGTDRHRPAVRRGEVRSPRLPPPCLCLVCVWRLTLTGLMARGFGLCTEPCGVSTVSTHDPELLL
ncbi:hypothetical protein QMK19_24860, partial [Streptomyces sp. H10-C2]|nr:hypothetical protein [Streptomyces sp. H10-C2]